MDEDQYRKLYHELNPDRCVFEKSINNRRCDCELKHRFLIATREGIACRSKTALANCTLLLNTMRDKARFVLKLVNIEGPVPHNKELRVQAGGLLGLQALTQSDLQYAETVLNAHQTVTATLVKYGSIEEIPYSDIIKEIATYKVRPKRSKKRLPTSRQDK
ncbi:MAG TPA: hypothetical protein ENJ51_04090 [Leucothrix mucor]|uniref:Uncharacterized protein n=1 Tax=Leucothrix mucor TaxID=45248 RepID=A0A7V2WUR5_LEUMU|nr:hypothetical protein [Leucothrix mucor]